MQHGVAKCRLQQGLRHKVHQLFAAVAQAAVSRRLRDFNPQNLANTVWAYATAADALYAAVRAGRRRCGAGWLASSLRTWPKKNAFYPAKDTILPLPSLVPLGVARLESCTRLPWAPPARWGFPALSGSLALNLGSLPNAGLLDGR